MSDTPKPAAGDGQSRLTVEVGNDESFGADIANGTASHNTGDGIEVDLSEGLAPEDDKEEGEKDPKETPEDDAGDEPGDGELGEFNPDDPELVEKFDAAYFKDGVLNKEALTAEFDKNDGKGLNASTYSYLQSTLGLDKETIKNIEAGQVALRKEAQDAYLATFPGGRAAFDAASEWAKTGYTEAQKQSFNKALAQGGDAAKDAMDLLLARAARAGAVKGAKVGEARRGPPRRPSSPARDATGNSRPASGGTSDGFASHAEYGKAWSEVLREVSDAKATGDRSAIKAAEAKREAIRAKAKRSRFGA